MSLPPEDISAAEGYDKTNTQPDLAKVIGFSKAYIYKFFELKQASCEMIRANRLGQIEAEAQAAG